MALSEYEPGVKNLLEAPPKITKSEKKVLADRVGSVTSGVSPVLGETVMTDEEFGAWYLKNRDSLTDGESIGLTYRKGQDSHTRKEVARVLRSLGGYHQGENGLVIDKRKVDQLIAALEANDAK